MARLDAFELIAKEGRKYGLNICLSTQRPRDITEGVLSQMGTLVVHRLTNDRDREVVERACGEIDRSASSFLPNLKHRRSGHHWCRLSHTAHDSNHSAHCKTKVRWTKLSATLEEHRKVMRALFCYRTDLYSQLCPSTLRRRITKLATQLALWQTSVVQRVPVTPAVVKWAIRGA